jgi:hypothetical protein
MAVRSNALKGLRKDKSEEALLRTLLIHLSSGYSLRETAVRARQAGLADMSDVALLKRLRKSKEWLAQLCSSLFMERGVPVQGTSDFKVRLFDATNVKEPGKTGSLWRLHYSVRIPSLRCDFVKVTGSSGAGTGESLKQFPIKSGDHVIADRGYATASGIEFVSEHRGYSLIRMSPHNLVVRDCSSQPMAWKERLGELQSSGQIGSWSVRIPTAGHRSVAGRVCAIRKTQAAIEIAHRNLRKRAIRTGEQLKPDTLLYAEYVIVFTTFPEARFTTAEVLQWYRIRWQIELVFKRFKQIAQLGHLPKYDEESAKAWLYGKLFVALMAEKLLSHARSISPWGCLWLQDARV